MNHPALRGPAGRWAELHARKHAFMRGLLTAVLCLPVDTRPVPTQMVLA